MSDWQYVRIRSWHTVKEPGFGGHTWRTLCGRNAPGDAEVLGVLPGAATCETCLRIEVRATPPVVAEDDGSTQPTETVITFSNTPSETL